MRAMQLGHVLQLTVVCSWTVMYSSWSVAYDEMAANLIRFHCHASLSLPLCSCQPDIEEERQRIEKKNPTPGRPLVRQQGT